MQYIQVLAYGPFLLCVACASGQEDAAASLGSVGGGSGQTDADDDSADGSGTSEPTGGGDGDGAGDCQASGTCPPGEACGSAEECSLGNCVEGICCDAPCDGVCQSCSAAGLCGATPANEDPACSPTCQDAGDCGGETEWAISFGAPTEGESYDRIIDVAVDGMGNIYVVGSFEGSFDLGNGALSSAGLNDIFVASFSPNRVHRWSRRLGGTGADTAHAVALLPAGGVVIAGSVSGDPGFGGKFPSSGLRGFVMTLDETTGTPLASTAIASTESSRLLDVDVGSGGEIFGVGGYFGELQAGPATTSVGDEDMFIVKLSADLTPQWNWSYGGESKDLLRGVSVSAAGAVAVTGYVSDTDKNKQTNTGLDVYVAHLADGPTPTVDWDETYISSSGGKDKAHNVVFLPDGDVVVAGYFGTDVNFGSGDLTSAGESEVFVVQLASNSGAAVWASRFGASLPDVAHAITADSSGNIIIAGRFQEQISFGGAALMAVDGQDAFVAKLSSGNGAHIWSHAFGGTSGQSLLGVATDLQDNVYVGGHFAGSVDSVNPPLAAADNVDALLLKLTP